MLTDFQLLLEGSYPELWLIVGNKNAAYLSYRNQKAHRSSIQVDKGGKLNDVCLLLSDYFIFNVYDSIFVYDTLVVSTTSYAHCIQYGDGSLPTPYQWLWLPLSELYRVQVHYTALAAYTSIPLHQERLFFS